MEPDQVARFERLFAAHYGDLMRFATRRVGADAAGDVVSSTFLIAWRRVADVPAGQSRAWLYGTARRVIANELRGRERRDRLGRRVAAHAEVAAEDHARAGAVAVTAAAVVAAGVVATPWSHGRPASAAYAVTADGDGAVSVTVHWDQLGDPAALNAELARLGARTVVMRVSADGACRTGFATDPAHPPYRRIKFDEHPELRDPARFREYERSQTPWLDQTSRWADGVAFTIRPDRIPAGDTLLIPYELGPSQPARPAGVDGAVRGSMLVQDVPACFPGPADAVYTTNGVEVR